MNLFERMDAFYGSEDRGKESDPLLSILRLAKRIRLSLGPKGYLLDNYLDLVLQGLDMGITSEAVEEGLETANRFQRHIVSCVVEGKEPETPNPLYNRVKALYKQHDELQAFQEHHTRIYLLTLLAEETLMEYVVSEFAAKQEIYRLGSGDIATLRELYDKIICVVDESQMEELNRRLRQLFQSTSLFAAFLQGCANELLYQLTCRDEETSRQIFQLLLDHLPEES